MQRYSLLYMYILYLTCEEALDQLSPATDCALEDLDSPYLRAMYLDDIL